MRLSRRGFVSGLLASSAAAVTASQAGMAPAGGRARLKFGVFSDSHIDTEYLAGMNEQAVARALRIFKARGADAVMCCGDIIAGRTVKEFRTFMKMWTDVFGSPKEKRPGKTELLFVTGNHEIWHKPEDVRNDPAQLCNHVDEIWPEFFGMPYEPVFHKRVKGFSFVGTNWTNAFSDWTHTWVSDLIRPKVKEAAAATEPGQPFFYFQHAPSPWTVYGSQTQIDAGDCSCCGGDAKRALRDYPNVLSFSGHTHRSVAHPRAIWQDTHTEITAGVMTWCDFRDYLWPHDSFPEVQNAKDALFVTVYDDRIVIERFNVYHGFPVGEDWTIPLPLARETFPYTLAKMQARAGAPHFPTGAIARINCSTTEIRLKYPWKREDEKDFGQLVSFPAAVPGPGDLVRAYDVTVYGADGAKVAEKRVNPKFFFGPAGNESFYQCHFTGQELPRGGKYTVKVVAKTGLCLEAELKGASDPFSY